jgi:glucose-6-phosphate 1-dehydrogenase
MITKLLIFGITGDLSTRKLLPALSAIIKTGNFDDVEIIGVSRRQVDIADLLQSSVGGQELAARVKVFSMDLAQAGDYDRLRDYVALKDDEQLIVYLSVPPSAASQIVDFMGEAGMNTPRTKLLFEKPFGIDLTSAEEMIARTARYYKEEQIYRIDHYLAKEMSQNIVAFRGGNALFTHLWNNQAIEKIEIIASEKIGIEGRAGFYEQTGALRDVLQGHLMQLLALTLMDIPDELDWDKVPELRLAALEALQPADPTQSVRAQYDEYQGEVENPGSLTETFASVELVSIAPQWKDVPFHLITGKALDRKTTEVRVHFRKQHEAQSNRLTFAIQPNEGVAIELFTKKPGYEREFESRQLAFTYPEDAVLPDAYEQVIVDAINSRKSLFTSSEEVLRSWQLLQPVVSAWEMDNAPLRTYAKGTAIDDIVAIKE